MQPSSQNIPRGGIYPFQKINRKFDFRSVCNKIPKTTAFTCILTLILGISYIKSHFFCIWVEFTFSKWNLILQSGIYFFNSPLPAFFHLNRFIFKKFTNSACKIHKYLVSYICCGFPLGNQVPVKEVQSWLNVQSVKRLLTSVTM